MRVQRSYDTHDPTSHGVAVDAPSTSDQLADLLQACADGDEPSFAELYVLTSARLFAVAIRIAGRRDWAEDVLQEGFVKVWRQAAQYSADRGAAMTWLSAIIRNTALDRLRRHRGEMLMADRPDDAPCLEPSLDPMDDLLSRDNASNLWRCLGELEPRQARVLLDAYCYGYTHEELAARYDAPVGTVKSWLRRGLLRLRTCLET